ncbi:MAG: addiction module protein [Sedimentisphaerales bacterium]|nr:addiction module protein [Sedimentisphaerales bacterium]
MYHKSIERNKVMGFLLPLNKMTISEKLAAMELLWEDICRGSENVPPFSWHGQILKEREKSISQGKSVFSDLNDAKARIKDATR